MSQNFQKQNEKSHSYNISKHTPNSACLFFLNLSFLNKFYTIRASVFGYCDCISKTSKCNQHIKKNYSLFLGILTRNYTILCQEAYYNFMKVTRRLIADAAKEEYTVAYTYLPLVYLAPAHKKSLLRSQLDLPGQ